ncbi:hypothetical protein RRG08_024130 [Elysia crispata]|uniref:Uncharacterized protein n=1 Tax=Elysia crispata TaxID=231223 RepID=A0AAE1D3E0_9GAST|nr:hypothetical protein RRG08_024130 [Elysia crispata]
MSFSLLQSAAESHNSAPQFNVPGVRRGILCFKAPEDMRCSTEPPKTFDCSTRMSSNVHKQEAFDTTVTADNRTIQEHCRMLPLHLLEVHWMIRPQ